MLNVSFVRSDTIDYTSTAYNWIEIHWIAIEDKIKINKQS